MQWLLGYVRHNWAILTVVILVTITVLSLFPLPQLPPLPGTDKTHHLIAYAVLMFPVALRKPGRWMLLGFVFIAYSGAIELIQPYVNRYGEWLDLAANTLGVVCGALLAQLMAYLFPVRSVSIQ